MRPFLVMAAVCWIAAIGLKGIASPWQEPRRQAAHDDVTFKTAATCTACHNGLIAPDGQDVSIAADWRGSIMANSARDPYWQAAVRRETLDHPEAAAEIEDECAVCHMPMSRTQANARGEKGRVFAHLPVSGNAGPDDLLAHDGVSCTLCHQISARQLGTPASFTGGFVVEPAAPRDASPIFGPFVIDKGRTRIMQSASGFQPTEGLHVQHSEMCATCHTLYTNARGPGGTTIGRFPEQVPYVEWRHSAFPAEQQSCQACHMPVVREATAITSVLGTPRQGLARHTFAGGNFFVLRMLNRYRADLGVTALPLEIDAATRWSMDLLQSSTASLTLQSARIVNGRLEADVLVRNLAGHKFPTGYPSRRAWLDLVVKDRDGAEVFRSGGVTPEGAIAGNDNDRDPDQYEPHYGEIRQAEQVQIYESVMADTQGRVTTGLLSAVRYLKDNRLLPRGFDKATAPGDAAVAGAATTDADFAGGADRVRYSVAINRHAGPFRVEVALRFQPIGYRWAQNLKDYDSAETRRFVSYFDAMSAAATEAVASAAATVHP